jgi:hypothetical protein
MRLIILLLLSLIPFLIEEIYASVYITDVKIIPEDIKINNTLVIEANILNNSNETIAYPSLCDSPLDTKFDDNIAIEYGIGCLGFGIKMLEPYENATVRGPASGMFYRVVDEGLTRANITFTYLVGEEKMSINKEIIFMIDGDKKVEDRFDIMMNQTILFDELEMTFIDIEDFRCPIDVTCVWGGDVMLSLSIERDGFIDNFAISFNQPLVIDNHVIEIASLEPDRTVDNIEKDKYQVTFTIKELEDSIKFKAYNEKYGMIGVVDLEKEEGMIILFNDNKRELLQFTNKEDCNRLKSMICFNANDMHIEIGRDFMLIDKQYIPTIDLKLI